MKRLIVIAFFVASFGSTSAKAQSLPCPTGNTCTGSVTFTVTFPAPSAPSAVSPVSGVAGASSPITLTLTPTTGNSFNNMMVVLACAITPTPCTTATVLTTTFVSASSLTASFPVSLLASSGTFAIYIEQPNSAHAANVTPSEILSAVDKLACVTCETFKSEILTTADFVTATL